MGENEEDVFGIPSDLTFGTGMLGVLVEMFLSCWLIKCPLQLKMCMMNCVRMV